MVFCRVSRCDNYDWLMNECIPSCPLVDLGRAALAFLPCSTSRQVVCSLHPFISVSIKSTADVIFISVPQQETLLWNYLNLVTSWVLSTFFRWNHFTLLQSPAVFMATFLWQTEFTVIYTTFNLKRNLFLFYFPKRKHLQLSNNNKSAELLHLQFLRLAIKFWNWIGAKWPFYRYKWISFFFFFC